MEITIVLLLLALALFLFSWNKIPVDITTAILLIVLVASGIISTGEAFQAYGSDFIVVLACIFVITGAIEKSGILDALAMRISKT